MASANVIKIGVVAVLGVGGLIYSQVDGDAARVREAENMANEGCACKTTACVDAVSQKFLAWANKHGDERVDDSDYAAVETSANKLAACLTRIEGEAPAEK